MMQDKKKAVSVLIARMKKPSEEVSKAPEKDGVEQDSSMGLESAADEIMSAVESKNPKALVSALKSFMEMCDNESPEHEQSESSEYEQSQEQK